MMYIYIHREFRSVLVKLHPITVHRTVFSVCGSCVECHLLFSLVSRIVSCSMINRLKLWSLWPLVFVLNNILTLGILHSAISHFPACFCPWTFFKNIGFNMVPSDPFMSHLAAQLARGVSGFATDHPCGIRCCGLTTWLLYVGPLCGNDQQFGCRFDIMDCESSFFCILTYAILYVLTHHMIFGFIFSSYIVFIFY